MPGSTRKRRLALWRWLSNARKSANWARISLADLFSQIFAVGASSGRQSVDGTNQSVPPIRFCKLEARRVLNASFDLVGANLQLSSFDTGTHLDISHDALTGSYQFNLSSGTWFDSSGANTGNNVLSVLDSVLTGSLSVDSALATNILLMGDLGSLDRVSISTLGQMTDAPGTSLRTTNDLSISANTILLGEHGTDSYQLGLLNLNSTGTAEVHAVGNLTVGSATTSDNLRIVADSLTLQSTNSQANLFAESRTGDILVGSAVASDNITLISARSILDLQDDALVDLQADATIDLQAARDIQGSGANPFLELADGSRVIAQSYTSGDIRLAGLGSLELENLSTKDGSITVQALGTLRAIQVDSSLTDSADNFLSLTASGPSSDLIVHRTAAGLFNADVTLIAARNIVDGDALVDDQDIVGRNVSIQSQSGWIGGLAGGSGDIFHESYQAGTSLEIIWSDHLRAASAQSVILNPTLGSGNISLLTPTAVLISNGDVNNAQIDTSSVENLAVIADADNDGNGIAILSNGPAVAGDLLVRGHDIASTAPLIFHANRFMLISGQAERFSVDSLDPNHNVQIDGQTTGTIAALSNNDIQLVDLNSDGTSLRSSAGSVLVSSQGGSIDVQGKLAPHRDLLLKAQDDIVVSTQLSTTFGHITLSAGDDVLILKSIESTQGGSICIDAGNSFADSDSGIVMALGTSIRTANSNVHLSSMGEGNIQLQQIDVGAAAISLIAEGGIMGAAPSHLLVAKELRLEADSNENGLGAIGQANPTNGNTNANELALQTRVSLLAAKSADGLYIINDGSITIDSVAPVLVQCVTIDESLVSHTDSSLSDLTSTHAGPIKLQTRNGDLQINDGSLKSQFGSNDFGVSGNGSGDILLQALGTDSDVVVNAGVVSQAGAIHVRANNAIVQQANLSVESSSNAARNSILVEAENGSISMSSVAVSRTVGGNIAYTAAQDILLSSLSAGQGSVVVNSGGSILDAHSDTVVANLDGFSNLIGQPRQENILAASASLRSVHGIGQATNPLDTSLGSLAASSAGSVYILESDDLVIGATQPIEATRIHVNSTIGSLIASGLSRVQASDGHAKIESIQGSLTVDQSIIAKQDVALVARGSDGITINDQVQAETGSVSVLATQVLQNAALATLSNDPSTSSVYVRSTAGEIAMSASATTTSAGNILYDSATNIGVGRLISSAGIIHLNAVGSILDSQTDSVTSNASGFAVPAGSVRQINLSAQAAAIIAGGDVGAAGNPLDTQVDVIAIRADGSVYLYETDSLSIGQVAAISALQVNLDSTTTVRTSGSLSGVTSTAGHAKIETQNGPMDVRAAVSAGTDILIAAGGVNGSIQTNANLGSSSGAIHLLAQQSIAQAANISVTSGTAASSNSILVEALGGTINMSPLSRTSTAGGNIAYIASGDIVVGVLDAASGSLLLRSGGSILDAQAESIGHDNNGFVVNTGARTENLLGNSAQLIAGGSIGTAGNPLDLKLETIALQSQGSSYILETDALKIGTVGPIAYTQVQLQSTSRTIVTALLAGGMSGEHFKAENLQSDFNVASTIRAARDVQLATPGVLTVDASIASQSGALSLLAQGAINQNANLLVENSTTTIDNSVFVQSLSGAIAMSTNAITQSNAGNIIYQSPANISLGQVIAPRGNIAITAGGIVADSQLDLAPLDGTTGFSISSGPTRVENLVASSLMIRAAAIGSANNPVDIDAGVLAIDARGEIALLESNGVQISSVSGFQAKRIHLDSTHQLQTVVGLSGLLSRDASIKLQSIDGDILVSSIANADGLGNGVVSNQAVLLAADGTGNLVIESDVLSQASDVWLAAGGIVATPPTNPGTDQSATIQGDHLTIYAGVNVFLPNTIINSVEAKITQARNALAPSEVINQTADQAGTLVLDKLQHGPTLTNPNLTDPTYPIETDSFDAWTDRFRFTERFADGYSLLIRNHNPLTIQAQNFSDSLSVSGQAPAVYIETLSPSQTGLGASDLVITGQTELGSTRVGVDPGIVLIANGALDVRGSIDLLTPLVTTAKTQTLNTLELNASAYHAGQGDPRFSNSADHNIPATTEYVVDPQRDNTEDYRTHVSQRVLMEFGSEQESGFMTIVHYADNAFQVFQSQGDTSKLSLGSDFELQVGTNDQRAIANTTKQAALFSRDTDFTTIDRFFVQNNRDLPTDVVIRRSLDYFLFSNAQSGEATEIVDHASYSQEIFDVKSLGTSSMGPITPIPDGIRPPQPPTRGDTDAIDGPLALTLPEVELRQVKSEVVEVAIYQISYDDSNENGQVENAELPTFDSVLNRVDQDSKLPISSKNVGQSPTQGEIDEEKVKLQNSPNQPSGAYAIIRKNADGKEEVLDVFSIRDWPEGEELKEDGGEMLEQSDSPQTDSRENAADDDARAQMDQTPAEQESDSEDRTNAGDDLHSILPARIMDDGQTTNSSSLGHQSRVENAAALMSTLWLLQRSTPRDSNNSTQSDPTHQQSHATEYDETSRRLRKIKRLVRQIAQQPEE